MANERYTRTNQKLYFASLALESWRAAGLLHAVHAQGRAQAEREAALFHLHGAVLALCHEVAGYYRMPQGDAGQVEVFLEAGRLADRPSPEFSELAELAGRQDSWLGQLIRAHGLLLQPPRETAKAERVSSVPLITAINLAEEEATLTPERVGAWCSELKMLVVRFREGLSESC